MKKIFAVFLLILIKSSLFAEANEIKITKGFGISFLPLIVAEEHKLVEKNAKLEGINDLQVKWVQLGGGTGNNEALLSGSVDIITAGVAPFVRLWDKTKGEVKALVTLDQQPLVFNTNNPDVKSIKDLTQKDRIAFPSQKVGIQALILQAAAAKEYGIENFDKFDSLTISLSHPDAAIALTSGKEITGHIASEPFISIELKNPNIHKVFSSYDIVGGKHSFNLSSTTTKFFNKNPKLVYIYAKSIDEAAQWINNNKHEAAKLYLKVTNSKEPVELIEAILNNPDVVFSIKPENITFFTDFLYETKAIKSKPASGEELFFNTGYVR
ncbi:MAG: ABC transporter substrate-binding protein [Campylobacteraceae bacterium]